MTLLAATYIHPDEHSAVLRVFDADAGAAIFTSEPLGYAQFGSPYSAECAVSVDEQYVSFSVRGESRIYKVADWSYITTYSWRVEFAANRKVYVDGGTIDPETGVVTPLNISASWQGRRKFSANGRTVIGRTHPSGQIEAYNLNSGAVDPLGQLVNSHVNPGYQAYLSFSQDGQMIAIAHVDPSGNHKVTLLSTESGSILFTAPIDYAVPVEFAVDGSVLYMSGEQINTSTFARSPWSVPMPSGEPFAPTVFIKGHDLAAISFAYNESFTGNTSGYVISTQAQVTPAWYDLPALARCVATAWGVPPTVPQFWTQQVGALEA